MRAIAITLVLCACSGTPTQRDSGMSPTTTPCGAGDLSCNAATEICVVETPVGPGEQVACKPLPAECGDDRSCACAGFTLCQSPFDFCSERAEPNTIVCECVQCQ